MIIKLTAESGIPIAVSSSTLLDTRLNSALVTQAIQLAKEQGWLNNEGTCVLDPNTGVVLERMNASSKVLTILRRVKIDTSSRNIADNFDD